MIAVADVTDAVGHLARQGGDTALGEIVHMDAVARIRILFRQDWYGIANAIRAEAFRAVNAGNA